MMTPLTYFAIILIVWFIANVVFMIMLIKAHFDFKKKPPKKRLATTEEIDNIILKALMEMEDPEY